jgi:GTP-binding protein
MQREALAEASGAEVRLVSGVSGKGVRELLREAYALVRERKRQAAEEEAGDQPEEGWTP